MAGDTAVFIPNVPYSRQDAVGMRSKTEWTAADLSGEVEFTIVRHEGSLQKVARWAAVALFLVIAWKSSNLLWRLLVALGALWPIADWLQGHQTQLRVGALEINARGNLGRLVRTTISVSTADVKAIEYTAGDEGESPGLYAIRKWGGHTLLVPDLDEAICREMVNRIAARFPEIGADREPGSLLYSESSNPIVLGLSDPSRH
jgi:hypothetical protein